jgi:hypothetical protein
LVISPWLVRCGSRQLHSSLPMHGQKKEAEVVGLSCCGAAMMQMRLVCCYAAGVGFCVWCCLVSGRWSKQRLCVLWREKGKGTHEVQDTGRYELHLFIGLR